MGIDVVTLALAKGYTDGKIRDAVFGDVPLDTSLTKNGQAADAKAVGDRLQSLSEEISSCVIAPTTAAVGQTIAVKSVNENGKPTEFQAESVANEVEALVSILECGFLTPVYQDGMIYTDSDGSIYIL